MFRAIFIAAGATLLESFHFLIYGLGLLLLFTGVKMWRSKGHWSTPSTPTSCYGWSGGRCR